MANSVPVLTGLTDTPTFIENGTAVLLDSDGNASVSDTELNTAGSYAGATLTLARHGGADADDVFSATGTLDLTHSNGAGENVSLDNGASFIGTFTNAGGTLKFTFNANAAAADVNAVMRQIAYANASDNPHWALAIDFAFDDGSDQPGGQPQGGGSGLTTASIAVEVTQVNDPPTLANVAPSAFYPPGVNGALLSPTLGVADVDTEPPSHVYGIKNAVVEISEGYLPGDRLFVNLEMYLGFFVLENGDWTNISYMINDFGRLILTGMDTVERYQAVLATIAYRSTAADPTDNGLHDTRTITWQVNDGAPVAGPLLTAPGTTYATAASPFEGVTIDINHDGVLDLVATTAAGISVLLGNGDGTFDARVDTSLGTSPRDIAAGDVNRDGHVDLVVAGGAGGVSVLLGDGAGGFAGLPVVATGPGATGVAIADFNSDGHADLVVANALGNTVSVLLGNGTGTYADPTNVPVGSTPVAVATGDFNGDGSIDIATADQTGNSVSILLGVGDGSFVAATTFTTGAGTAPIQIAVAPLNNDDRLDLVTANSNGTISVLLGNGAGGFGAPTTFATGNQPHDVTVGDVNGDGWFDVVTADSTGTGISVLLGDGLGKFAAATQFAAGPGASATMLGDYDRDGALDVAVVNASSSSISILLGNSTNTNAPASTLLTFNHAPIISGVSNAGYTEQAAASVLAAALVLDDTDGGTIKGATIAISAGALAGDVLAAVTTGTSIHAVFASGTLTLSGTDTRAHYQAVLRSVTFAASGDNPTSFGAATSRTISWTARDQFDIASTIVTSTVDVTAVNDAPVAAITPASLAATEQTVLNLKGGGFAVGDVDGGAVVATLSVGAGILDVTAGGSGAIVTNSGTSSVTITGTLAEVNALLMTDATSTVTYFNDSDVPPANTTLTLSVNDGGNTGTGGPLTGSDTATIDIAGVDDAIIGTSASEELLGTSHDETIDGKAGNDTIDGNGGNDTIVGGNGADIVTGGGGEDVFVFKPGDLPRLNVIDQVIGAFFGLFLGKYDVITDFEPGTDVIDLSAIDANTHRDGDQAFHFEGHDRLSHSRGELVYRFGQDGDGDRATIITGDANGDGSADFRILLKGQQTLHATDFIL